MILDLKIDFDRVKALKYLEKLIERKAVITLAEKIKPKTKQQNRYIHVLFSLFGIELGYRKEEAKTLVKRNCPFMVYDKNDEKFLRSVGSLTKDEAKAFIEWFRTWSSTEHSVYLPSSEEYWDSLHYIEREIDRHKSYL